MSPSPSVSIFHRRWLSHGVALSVALLCLLTSPARSPAQDAGVSGIPPGPANARGTQRLGNDPSGIGNAARVPALPQPSIAPVMPPALAPSAGYRTFSPAASYRPIHVRRAVRMKRTRFTTTRHRRSAKAHARRQDRRPDSKTFSICRGC